MQKLIQILNDNAIQFKFKIWYVQEFTLRTFSGGRIDEYNNIHWMYELIMTK